MKKALLLVCALAVVAVGAAKAITYGQPDGNGHPNVGAFVYWSPSRNAWRITCTGSLISPTVFLTASHCTSYLEAGGITRVGVSFDPEFDASKSKVYTATMHTNPLYNQTASDPQDIAVLTLDKAVNNVTPAQLPQPGLLDQMKKAGTLNGTRFTSVGYGDQEASTAPGGLVYPFTGERRVVDGEFNSLTNVWLKISQNYASGSGGTCYGDSGGPQFLGAGATETNTQVSITITGDSVCKATNVDYRLDTPQARAFLSQFVSLP